MFEKLSLLLKKSFEEVKEKLKLNGIFQLGTEGILYALIKIENSICNNLLFIKNIDKKLIENKIEEIVVLRKNNKEYTEKFEEVFDNAEKIAIADKSDLIYDEHLLYSLLLIKDSVALNILENFGLDLNETLNSVKNIFELDNEDEPYLINLTKDAENNKLNTFIGRKKHIEKIIRIFSKKQKNNVMLIGNAGVGKSALVEGLAVEYLKIDKSINIYRLDLGGVLAGTKYRGDLEERITTIISKIKSNKTILFIDEIHNIIGNYNSESSLDIANILKPILARNKIKCIGATTLEEYYKYIDKDKAFSRRFQNLFIEEPKEKEMFFILKGIVSDYEQFYNIKYSDEILLTIIEKCNLLSNRYFPDKAIDILDECGLNARESKRHRVNKEDVNKIVFEFLGIDYKKIQRNLNKKINFPQLKKYYYDYLLNISERKTILNISLSKDSYSLFINDLKFLFNITKEMILEIDFGEYLAEHYSSNLFGSPSGYVGFESGGILTEHVNRYPLSVIIIDNYDVGHYSIKKQIENILKNGEIIDNKGRKINFRNSFFVFRISEKEKEKRTIGFIEKISNETCNYIDEVIAFKKTSKNYKINYIKKLIKNYIKNDIVIKINFEINESNSDKIIFLLKEADKFKCNKINIINIDTKGNLFIENK